MLALAILAAAAWVSAYAQSIGGMSGIGPTFGNGASGGGGVTCSGVIDVSKGCTLGVLP